MKKTVRAAALTVALFAASALAFAAQPDFKAMLNELDSMADFGGSDYTAVMTIVTQKPGEKDSTSQIRFFRRDAHDQFVMLILLPDVQKGQGYLKIDENVWFYDPDSRKFNHSTMKENISNSKAKNSDLTKRTWETDYEIASTGESMINKYPVWVIELKAKNEEVSYPKEKLYVRKDMTILMRQEDYSVSDRLMRTTSYLKYAKVGSRLVPSQILIEDELNPGEKSQMTMTEPSIAKLPDKVFNKLFLEQVSQ
jgi:outer membrane lipoprotein-sorting protein